ncbi:Deoxyuridine 5'-triphosphate nucleotidohydrolase [Porphyridium purpureum]|uniref:dUTP diphosphatase n=1 Tax=Porphyridium purpureum TaxID=35688 RepID=A0A5J4Z0F1_PORPP|nr:Deoxyuridine 5'-triphosphate nucleotidohydrolase [Porphyridium purpureum]|eukprot:POR1364..scf208_2
MARNAAHSSRTEGAGRARADSGSEAFALNTRTHTHKRAHKSYPYCVDMREHMKRTSGAFVAGLSSLVTRRGQGTATGPRASCVLAKRSARALTTQQSAAKTAKTRFVDMIQTAYTGFVTNVTALDRESRAYVTLRCATAAAADADGANGAAPPQPKECDGNFQMMYVEALEMLDNGLKPVCVPCRKTRQLPLSELPSADQFYLMGWAAVSAAISPVQTTKACSFPLLSEDAAYFRKLFPSHVTEAGVTDTAEKRADQQQAGGAYEFVAPSRGEFATFLQSISDSKALLDGLAQGKDAWMTELFKALDACPARAHVDDFMRGVFDACGKISDQASSETPACAFQPGLAPLARAYADRLGVPYNVMADGEVWFHFSNCIDLLGRMYLHCGERVLKSKHQHFLRWITWASMLLSRSAARLPECQVFRSDPAAIIPSKSKVSDVGYDLTVIKVAKQLRSNVTLYDTGIRIRMKHGIYCEVAPRSSLSKSGYMLANSVGIIDASYNGNLFVALVKVDPDAPELPLPFRCCQLIFRYQVHAQICEVPHMFDDTARGHGGFGSTGHD